MRKLVAGACACLWVWVPSFAAAPPAVEPVTINRISDAAFNHGEVVDIAAYLADQIGGRLTNSPAMRRAERWTSDQFKSWGLKDVRADGFDFGRGWWIEYSRVRMTAPRALELHGIPIAWTPALAVLPALAQETFKIGIVSFLSGQACTPTVSFNGLHRLLRLSASTLPPLNPVTVRGS